MFSKCWLRFYGQKIKNTIRSFHLVFLSKHSGNPTCTQFTKLLKLLKDNFLQSGNSTIGNPNDKVKLLKWITDFLSTAVTESCMMTDGAWSRFILDIFLSIQVNWLKYALCCHSWHWDCRFDLFVNEYPLLKLFLLSKNESRTLSQNWLSDKNFW